MMILTKDISFLSERMKILNFEKFVAKLHDKKEYVIHIKNQNKNITYWISFGKITQIH